MDQPAHTHTTHSDTHMQLQQTRCNCQRCLSCSSLSMLFLLLNSLTRSHTAGLPVCVASHATIGAPAPLDDRLRNQSPLAHRIMRSDAAPAPRQAERSEWMDGWMRVAQIDKAEGGQRPGGQVASCAGLADSWTNEHNYLLHVGAYVLGKREHTDGWQSRADELGGEWHTQAGRRALVGQPRVEATQDISTSGRLCLWSIRSQPAQNGQTGDGRTDRQGRTFGRYADR